MVIAPSMRRTPLTIHDGKCIVLHRPQKFQLSVQDGALLFNGIVMLFHVACGTMQQDRKGNKYLNRPRSNAARAR